MPVGHVLVDGNDARGLGSAVSAIVRGDSLVACIAAASVVAKVARDSLMADLAPLYPGYGFEGNRGYGSADHMEHLLLVGPSKVHRLSFAPCAERDRLF
jgi:ribonuclease HII